MKLLKAEDRTQTEWLHFFEGEPPTRVCSNPETIGEWAGKLLGPRHAKKEPE